jgi:predicted transcriptional regulator
VIYATSPVKAVIGVAEIERLEEGSPRKLWKEFRNVGGIDRAHFFRYFSGIQQGVAYVVRRTWTCDEPVPLGREGLPPTAPQAFRYVNGRALDAVLDQSRVGGAATSLGFDLTPRQPSSPRRS